MPWEGYSITSEVLLPKIYNLHLIMKEHQTSKLKGILKQNGLILPGQEKDRWMNCSRLEGI